MKKELEERLRILGKVHMKNPNLIKFTKYVADDKVVISPEACKQCGDWFWYGHTNPWKRKDINRIIIIPGGKSD